MKRKLKSEQVFPGVQQSPLSQEDSPHKGESMMVTPEQSRKIRLLKKVKEEQPY